MKKVIFNLRIQLPKVKLKKKGIKADKEVWLQRKDTQFTVISQSLKHIEVVHILGDENPLPAPYPEMGPYKSDNFELQPAHAPRVPYDPLVNQQQQVALDLFLDGIIMCRSIKNPHNYIEEDCNLEFNWDQGDTIAFQFGNLMY